MNSNQQYEVVIYENDKLNGEDVVKIMGPMSERKAEKVEAGARVNLNHDKFTVTTRVVKKECSCSAATKTSYEGRRGAHEKTCPWSRK